MKVIVYREGVDVRVVIPSAEWLARFPDEDSAIVALRQKDVPPDAVEVLTTDTASLPADRILRNAWRLSAGAVVEDDAAAREVVAARLERKRLGKARELLEREMTGEDIAAERAALQSFDPAAAVAGKSAAELKAPDILDPPALGRRARP